MRLAEHRTLPGIDGSVAGLSTFLVEPTGTSAATLVLPADYRILTASAAGAVVSPQPAGDGRWTIPFASDQMPHVIEVLYESQTMNSLPAPADSVALPHFDGLRAERSLVAVYSPLSGASRMPAAVGVTRIRGNRERLSAFDAALAELTGDGSRTAGDWSAPLRRRRAQIIRELRLDAESAPQAEESQAVLALLKETAAATSPTDGVATASEGVDLAKLWTSGPGEACDAVYTLVGDDVRELAIRSIPRDATTDWRMVYLPLICGLLAVVCWLLARNDGFLRWPQLIAVVVGTGWLLLLRPTVVGWIILAVVVACRLHPSLRHVRERLLNVSPKLSALRKN
ncbi:MAG: hypothetical protein QM775_30700 [Pirellulales bacterium]